MNTIDLIDGGNLIYEQFFLAEELAQEYFETLRNECQWKSEVEAKGQFQLRLTAAYGDLGVKYSETGALNPVLPWTPALLSIKEKIESVQGWFNYCHLVYYKSGPDDVPWHADPTDRTGTMIASLSLGSPRRFRIRHRVKRNPRNFIQDNGTLIIMDGTMQENWQHDVHPIEGNGGERMKLTFRFVASS